MGLSSKLFRVFVVSVLLVSVFGCGKSDDKQQQEVKNLSPTVSIALDSSSASGSDILEVVEGNPNLIVIHATANDPEGQSLSYEWNVTSDLSLDLGNVNTNKLEFVAPDVKEDSVFDVTVTVSDVKGASAQASSSFTIKKVNNAPIITLDETMSVGELSAFTLASVATDADDDELTFLWEVTNDNGTGFVINDPSSSVLNGTIGDVAGNVAIELALSVTDDDGATTTKAVSINVLNDADAPTGIQIVSASAESITAITLDWLEAVDNVSNASQLSYNVHLSDQNGFVPSATTLHSSIAEQFTTTVDDLVSDTQYYVIIEVVDNSGNSAFSKQVTVSTLAKQTVVNTAQKVSNVAPAGFSSSEVSYQLTNEEVAPATGDIVVSTDNDGMLRKVTEVVVDGDTVTLQTEAAAVNEVYEQLDISTNIKLIDVSNDNLAAGQNRLAQRGVRSKQVTSGGKKVSSATWVRSGLTIVDEKAAVVTPVVPVLKSVAAAGQKSANAKAANASNTTDEYQELDEDNLRLQGPKQKLFVPGKLTQFEVSAQVILDTEDKFDLEYFKLVKFTHPRFGSSHDHGANVTEVQAGDGSDKVDLLFSWVPGKDHIDTENYEPYTAIFEAKIDKVGLLDGNDVLKIEVDVYVGYELETKSNESINGDGNDALVKLTADTNFSFEPTIDIKVDIESGKLVKAHAFVKGLTKFDATLSIESDGSKDLHGSKNLISRSFVKVIAPGGVPIIVRGKFKLDAEINGKAEGSVKLSHILESTLNITTGFAYDNGNWDPRTHFDPTLKYRIEGEAKAKVYGDVRLIPSLELFFYEAATGKIIVEPYLYAEAGVEGHYRSEASLETGVDTQLDYRFTEMAAGIGAELKLRAALEIFDKTIFGWPSRDKDEYKTITLMAKTPVIGIPSIDIEDITNPLNVNSCLIELKATVTPIYKPFSSTEPSIAWQSDSIGWAGFPLAANDTIWATTSNGDNEFYAQATLTSKTDYDLRFGGHSRLGSWARQYQDLSIDFSPDDSSSLPTYWANRYGLSQALADDDNDGLTNIEEFENCTVPNNRDSDGDEMLDGDEIKYNLNPLVNDASDDADNDGIPNLVEVQEGGNPNVANEAPTAKIINLQYNVEASTLVLGVEASDPDGQIISYKWREEGTSVATIESPTSSQTTIYLPIVQQDTVLRFSVTVEDNLYVTTTEYFEVVVPYIEPVNQPPVAVIEAALVAQEQQEVTLDGTKSSDLEDDAAGLPLAFLWQQTSGPSVALNTPNAAVAVFDVPELTESAEFTFSLTVTDSKDVSHVVTHKIVVDVVQNIGPTFISLEPMVVTARKPYQTFTITGENLPDTLAVSLFSSPSCKNLKVVSANLATITCDIPDTELLELPFYIKDKPQIDGGDIIEGAENLLVTVNEPELAIAYTFDYPIGNKGWDNGTPIELTENIDPETNEVFESGTVSVDGYHRAGHAISSKNDGWYNYSDVGNFIERTALTNSSGAQFYVNGGLHPGEDWNRNSVGDDDGALVYAVADGEVVLLRSFHNSLSSGGWVMVIKHTLVDDSNVYSLYGHITSDQVPQSDATVSALATDFTYEVGDPVIKGKPIARLAKGSAISCCGAHLHFEMRDQINLNDLYPQDNGQGYYNVVGDTFNNFSGNNANAEDATARPISAAVATASITTMKQDGVIDPSDFIDAHRIYRPDALISPVTATLNQDTEFVIIGNQFSSSSVVSFGDSGFCNVPTLVSINTLTVSCSASSLGPISVKVKDSTTGETLPNTENLKVTIGLPVTVLDDGSSDAGHSRTFTIDDSGNTVASITWDWGDGSDLETTNTTSNSHTYLNVGNYTVSLVITLSDGTELEQTLQIEVTQGEINSRELLANAGADLIVYAQSSITLDASLSSIPDDEVVSYQWLLELESLSSGTEAVQVINELPLGEHVITLVIEDSLGNTSSDLLIIQVVEKPSITSISPRHTAIYTPTLFTISGEHLPSSIDANIIGADCSDKQRISDTSFTFICQSTVVQQLAVSVAIEGANVLLSNIDSNINFNDIEIYGPSGMSENSAETYQLRMAGNGHATALYDADIWSVDDSSGGSINQSGLFVANAMSRNGNHVQIRAEYNGLELLKSVYISDSERPSVADEALILASEVLSCGDDDADVVTRNVYRPSGVVCHFDNSTQSTVVGRLSLHINSDLVLQNGTLDLEGKTLVIDGDFIQEGGILNLNGGTLIVRGDYRMQKQDETAESGYTFSDGFLKMIDSDDYMLVHGDFYMDSRFGGFDSHSSSSYYIYNGDWLTAGTLELKGDFTQLSTSTTDVVSYLEKYYPYENFQATGEHTVLLSGSEQQTISFSDPAISNSHFNILEIDNDMGIVFDSTYVATELYTYGNEIGELTIETQDFALVDDHTINGDVLLKGKTLNLNGRSLTIKGNLIHSGGNLLVNNGRLEVEGDYRIQKPDTESETGYTYSSGVLRMENVDDYILVHGDFVMDSRYGGFDTHSSSSYYIYNGDWLTAGTLELKGDLTQLSTSTTDTVSYLERYYPHENFQATVSHKVILSGESKQVISFEDAAVNSSHFNYLEITNTSNEGVTFESVAYVTNGLASTVSQINNSHNIHIANRFSIDEGNWPFDLTIAGSVSLEKNQEIVGNLYLDNSLNLNGFNLTVNGNVEQHAGILQMAGGYLTIGGDYRMQIPDDSTDSGYTFSNGFLKMTNPNDYMLVHGDFYMDSRYGGFDSHSSSSYYIYNGDWLIAGTLELKGDFTQLSTSTTDVVSYLERYYPHENFQSTGEHQVILYGSAEFEDPESSFFNDPDG